MTDQNCTVFTYILPDGQSNTVGAVKQGREGERGEETTVDLAEAALIRHLHSPPQVQCTLKAKSLQDRTSFQSSRKQNSCTRFYNLRKSLPLRANSSHKMLMPLEETVWPACQTWQGQAPLPPKHRPAAAMPVQMPVPELAGYFIFEISGACQEDEESS
ncbi:hypothetical protein BKA67DRAFT_537174 [Truncatella angustata]|uniref:Uncharacterized protein n=1 Tax=Truncatella angustata TaxID=152316 RepID=A0A9P8UK00_9PEZI|nr:uncharacterized protein BKA67DRAFT_537174 [Truncatella angustata]KAH6653511.1 hypothetical protein BKA67DRAFT_537174 [Truncatella angustata]